MSEGRKDDGAKLDLTLVPPVLIEEVARVMAFGAVKYERDNWQKVPDAERRYLAATLRHLLAHQRGETTDPETGLTHLAHAACNLGFLLWFWETG